MSDTVQRPASGPLKTAVNHLYMQLMANELAAHFQVIGDQENTPDPIVIARYFYPAGPATWWATQYDAETKTFFGYVTLFGLGSWEDEWGSFSLEELEQFQGRFGVGIERDLFFTEAPFSEVMKRERKASGLAE
jgi:hypothetical protein